ncbi:hypothetical protein MLP_16020 [Microlunatus phosphovorus NM-1]|uniref:Uncharacterized protein n=1 Tax=Microlunatus phosphovorus (strain ATCC 700054 / DSM 10555 / JCM 9379 / NBRC 101784 / NCIMB 13414 / VKM Ac-1990 / NM-1) TaxID=1032480 RepID=F5XRC6_MICPN|nr:hypothetical protein MLP_16020 [Microlunatus phosphovorus NM-1]
MVTDPTFMGSLLLPTLPSGPPLVMASFFPMPVSSVDTAPFGLGVAPWPGPLGRVRNRMLTVLAGGARDGTDDRGRHLGSRRPAADRLVAAGPVEHGGHRFRPVRRPDAARRGLRHQRRVRGRSGGVGARRTDGRGGRHPGQGGGIGADRLVRGGGQSPDRAPDAGSDRPGRTQGAGR